jgi:hypothetical protein
MLDSGGELPLDQVRNVMPAKQAAQILVGQMIAGLDRSDPDNPDLAEGVVTGVREEAGGQVVLELDSGAEIALGDVLSAAPASAETVS